jgi:hypothetical protein
MSPFGSRFDLRLQSKPAALTSLTGFKTFGPARLFWNITTLGEDGLSETISRHHCIADRNNPSNPSSDLDGGRCSMIGRM